MGNVKIYNNLSAIVEKSKGYKKFVDEMSSNAVDVKYDNGEIDSLYMAGMASANFHVVDDTLLMGLNKVSGDSIRLVFNQSDLENLKVIGGSRGEFFPERNNSSIDTTITYSAEKIEYNLIREESYLYDKSSVSNQETELQSGFIYVNWKTNILEATEKYDQRPLVLSNSSEPMEGNSLSFNLVNKKYL